MLLNICVIILLNYKVRWLNTLNTLKHNKTLTIIYSYDFNFLNSILKNIYILVCLNSV